MATWIRLDDYVLEGEYNPWEIRTPDDPNSIIRPLHDEELILISLHTPSGLRYKLYSRNVESIDDNSSR